MSLDRWDCKWVYPYPSDLLHPKRNNSSFLVYSPRRRSVGMPNAGLYKLQLDHTG